MSDPLEYLDYDDVIEIASAFMEVLVRDPGALESAVGRPRVSVFGEDAYPTLSEKAAALLHSIARNHPLVDGNKRLAWASARVFLLLNGHRLDLGEDEAVVLVLAVAAGSVEMGELSKTLRLVAQA